MKFVLAIRHVHFEDLGWFAPILQETGYDVRYCDVGVDDLSGIDPLACDILAVLGGPIGVYEDDKYPFIRDEIRIVRERLAARRPTLGLCLGSQMMAEALGARVHPGRAKEIGWAPIVLTPEGLKSPLRHLDGAPVLHWHGDTYPLPRDAARLASTAITENQAFSIGHHALALQFHVEVAARGFERWLTERWAADCAVRGRRLLLEWLEGL